MKKMYILFYFILTSLFLTAYEINKVENIHPTPNSKITTYSPYIPDPIFFRINKSVVEAAELIKIEKVVDHLNNESEAKIILTGFADKKTGTDIYNMELSEKRVKNIAEIFIEKYKIDTNRIKIGWKGSTIQPFKINEWNRVVIITIE